MDADKELAMKRLGDRNKALVRRIIETALNGGDLSIADETFRPDYVTHVPGVPPLPPGPEGFKAVIAMWRTACPDLHMQIEQLVAEDDFVANRFTTTGTNTGPLMGIPPTGRKMVVHGQELHRIVDGKLVESWISDDVPSICVQLGILPPPPFGGQP